MADHPVTDQDVKAAVLGLHAKRTATNEYMAPYTYDYCVEDRQTWPCATVKLITGEDE